MIVYVYSLFKAYALSFYSTNIRIFKLICIFLFSVFLYIIIDIITDLIVIYNNDILTFSFFLNDMLLFVLHRFIVYCIITFELVVCYYIALYTIVLPTWHTIWIITKLNDPMR